jgi:hypothetical protein
MRVEARIVAGAERALIRVFTRATPGSNGYFAELDLARGWVGLYRWSDGQVTTLTRQPADLSAVYDQQSWTAVAIRARGQRLWLLLNEQPLLSARDATLESGGGLLALVRTGNPDDDEESAVIFRNLRVSALATGDPARRPSYESP